MKTLKLTTKRIVIILTAVIVGGLAFYGMLVPRPKEQLDTGSVPTPTTSPAGNVQEIIVANPQRDYEIVYEPLEDLYIISILKKDFENIRKIAEQDLLTRLKLTPETACTLKVTITAPYYASPDRQQVYNKFSFCP